MSYREYYFQGNLHCRVVDRQARIAGVSGRLHKLYCISRYDSNIFQEAFIDLNLCFLHEYQSTDLKLSILKIDFLTLQENLL